MQSPYDRLKENLITVYKNRRLIRGVLGFFIFFIIALPLALMKALAWIPFISGIIGWSIFISDSFNDTLDRLKHRLHRKALHGQLQKMSHAKKLAVASVLFWVFIVLTFVLTFEPYGTFMNSEDWWHAFKIIIFPPIVMFVGYFLLVKVVK
jgi:hypothetical protein